MKKYFYIILLPVLFAGCKKGYLDAKPDQSLLVPTTLTDFQSLLDNNTVMNVTPAISTISSDDIYTTSAGYTATSLAIARNSYLWADDVFAGSTSGDWDIPYQQVFYANVVLDGLAKITVNATNQSTYDNLKGQALFTRAYAYYNLAQVFAGPYNPATSASVFGLPLHLTSDVNLRPGRGTLQQTYNQIITDLQQAAALLPAAQTVLTRAGKTAAWGMLARASLMMQNYTQAKLYADSCLSKSNTLIDYNTLSATATKPFPALLQTGNPEVLFYSSLVSYAFLKSTTACLVDSSLYQSYGTGDLRKTIYFNNKGKGVVLFKGSYGGTGVLTNFFFSGLAVDEIYLIRAECNARLNNTSVAMTDLNTLLAKRYAKGSFTVRTAINATDALQQVVMERRRELVFRGVRWADLRRLNQESGFAIGLTRMINGVNYVLAPNGNKYTFPIPPDEIAAYAIPQNPR